MKQYQYYKFYLVICCNAIRSINQGKWLKLKLVSSINLCVWYIRTSKNKYMIFVIDGFCNLHLKHDLRASITVKADLMSKVQFSKILIKYYNINRLVRPSCKHCFDFSRVKQCTKNNLQPFK